MKTIARKLRRQQTPSEQLLWRCLRNHHLGYGFRRQHPIGPFIVDFFCFEKNLIIEVDGDIHSHSDVIKQDQKRQAFLEKAGYQVVRFSADEVLSNVDGVVSAIAHILQQPPP